MLKICLLETHKVAVAIFRLVKMMEIRLEYSSMFRKKFTDTYRYRCCTAHSLSELFSDWLHCE